MPHFTKTDKNIRIVAGHPAFNKKRTFSLKTYEAGRSFYLAPLLSALFLIFACCGCSAQKQAAPAHLSADYGKAYQAVFTAQLANPQAPKDPSPINTLPGNVASEIYKKRITKSLTEEKEEESKGASGMLKGM